MARWRADATRHPAPHRVNVAVCGSGYMCRAHRQTPVQSDGPADSTSATRATSNGGDVPTMARRLSLYAYRRYPRRHTDASPQTPGTWCPAASRGPETIPCFCEDRGKRGGCRSPAAVPQPERASRAFLTSSPRLACLVASTPLRPWAGGAYRVHPHRPAPHALAPCRDATACAPTARSGVGRPLGPPAWLGAIPSRSRGANVARFALTPHCHVWPGVSRRAWRTSSGCDTRHRPAGLL
jgi:hypothetical protein